MRDPKHFLTSERIDPLKESPDHRKQHYGEFVSHFSEELAENQASRCMDCGIPFCHNACPLGNRIPDFNHAVVENQWFKAYQILAETNNFPEFTGRICPAPCEASCVLSLHQDAVSIEQIERKIIEYAFERSWVKPFIPDDRTGKKIAIIGSGPAGLAAADQLNKTGHSVTVYEKDAQPGGLLRYGIPDFKLEKHVIDRRISIMKKSGIEFICSTEIGLDIEVKNLLNEFDAICISIGSHVPRDLKMTGREAKGIYFAMDFLKSSNEFVDGITKSPKIDTAGKHVVVIGGGDTGADCVGTANRQGAKSIVQLEIADRPGDFRTAKDPWPLWPMTMRTSSSHEEGCEREWSVMTTAFVKDRHGQVTGLEVIDAQDYDQVDSNLDYQSSHISSARIIPCDNVFIAAGFLHPAQEIFNQFGIEDSWKNRRDSDYSTAVPKVFVAGDARRGQSLVVWAIAEGRAVAKQIDQFVMGQSVLRDQIASYQQLMM